MFRRHKSNRDKPKSSLQGIESCDAEYAGEEGIM